MNALGMAVKWLSLVVTSQVVAPPPPSGPPSTPAETPAPVSQPQPAHSTSLQTGQFSAGKFVLRGSINLDLNQSINLGGSSTSGARVTVGVNGGVGYYAIENLSLDLDARFAAFLTPSPGVSLLEFTPGARYVLLQNIQLRVGVPIPVYPQLGVGILGGVSYIQSLGIANLVVGVDYTYYVTDYYRSQAPFGRLDVHAGVQKSF